MGHITSIKEDVDIDQENVYNEYISVDILKK